ncbi:hypothetical protein CMK20_06455 [Candidatus Poribacteria bacterium]|nr:hypothetical protein [Candidatus Poribacteria bacterium]
MRSFYCQIIDWQLVQALSRMGLLGVNRYDSIVVHGNYKLREQLWQKRYLYPPVKCRIFYVFNLINLVNTSVESALLKSDVSDKTIIAWNLNTENTF